MRTGTLEESQRQYTKTYKVIYFEDRNTRRQSEAAYEYISKHVDLSLDRPKLTNENLTSSKHEQAFARNKGNLREET